MDPEKASETRFSKEGDEMIRNEAKKKKKYKGYFCLGIVGPAQPKSREASPSLQACPGCSTVLVLGVTGPWDS